MGYDRSARSERLELHGRRNVGQVRGSSTNVQSERTWVGRDSSASHWLVRGVLWREDGEGQLDVVRSLPSIGGVCSCGVNVDDRATIRSLIKLGTQRDTQ